MALPFWGACVRLSEGVLDLVELVVGLGPDCLNGGQANDDNESQHHGIFDRGGPVFGDQKPFQTLVEFFHNDILSVVCDRRVQFVQRQVCF
jgi:hypothetical protein